MHVAAFGYTLCIHACLSHRGNMPKPSAKTFEARVQPWGNSMGLRLTRAVHDLAEHELLASLTPYTAHADELPQLLAQETDYWLGTCPSMEKSFSAREKGQASDAHKQTAIPGDIGSPLLAE